MREIFEFVEIGKHSRGKGCQLVFRERDEEQMKMKTREGGERNGMKEKPGYQDLQKHLKEGRRDR